MLRDTSLTFSNNIVVALCVMLCAWSVPASAQVVTVLGANAGASSVGTVAAPVTPGTPSPADTATSVAVNPTLTWISARATTYDVNFGTSMTPPTVSTGQVSASYLPAGLVNSTTYYWQIVAHNAGGMTTGPVWSFTTITAGSAPGTPSTPSPADTANQVTLQPTLTWVSTNATTYDVGLSISSSNPVNILVSGLVSPSWTVSFQLQQSTIYYWQITGHNSNGTTLGPVWSFTTAGAPGAPTLSTPANAATNQSTSPTLTWTAGAGITNSYQVLLDTVTPPVQVVSASQTALSYAASGLSAGPSGTKYYWQVNATNTFGTTQSAIFSFTTAAGVPTTPTLVFPQDGATNVLLAPTYSWTSGGATTCTVKRDTSNPPTTVIVNNQAVFSYADSGLSQGTLYYLAIFCTNTGGNSPTTQVSFTTCSGGACNGVPGNLAVWGTNTTAIGAFQMPSCGGSACGTIKNYQGTFIQNASFGNDGTGLAFNSASTNSGISAISLFLSTGGPVNLTTGQHIAEISIPALGNASCAAGSNCKLGNPSSAPNTWPRAVIIQTAFEPTEGAFRNVISEIGSETYSKMQGLRVISSKLYFSEFGYYESNNLQTGSWWRRPFLSSTTGQVEGGSLGPGGSAVGLYAAINTGKSPNSQTRYANGALADIPSSLQSYFGGKTHLATQMPYNQVVSGNFSYGPTAIAWSPATDWSSLPTSCGSPGGGFCGVSALYYPTAANIIVGGGTSAGCFTNGEVGDAKYPTGQGVHGPTRYGDCSRNSNGTSCAALPCVWGAGPGLSSSVWNSSSWVAGAEIIPTSRSFWVFGRIGTGTLCYGQSQNTYNPSTAGYDILPAGGGAGKFEYCYSPVTGEIGQQGETGQPYNYRIWAYDLQDLNAVVSGGAPYTPQPTLVDITIPSPPSGLKSDLLGTAIDPDTTCSGIKDFNGNTISGAAGCLYILQDQQSNAPYVYVYKLSTP